MPVDIRILTSANTILKTEYPLATKPITVFKKAIMPPISKMLFFIIEIFRFIM